MLVYLLWTSLLFSFFSLTTPTPDIYTLSLHDALPICGPAPGRQRRSTHRRGPADLHLRGPAGGRGRGGHHARPARAGHRSEEHTSELQSPCNLVCRLLLEKKNEETYN